MVTTREIHPPIKRPRLGCSRNILFDPRGWARNPARLKYLAIVQWAFILTSNLGPESNSGIICK